MTGDAHTPGPVIIGGASRSGTSLMVRLLAAACRGVGFLPCEGWMTTFVSEYPVLRPELARDFVIRYLMTGRATDTGRTRYERPIDTSAMPLADYLREIDLGERDPFRLSDRVLSLHARSNGADRWGIKDTYIETGFTKILRRRPDARLIVMVRDPRASLCSELYFGTWPERNRRAACALPYRLALWSLSVETARALARRQPERVMLVRYEDLVAQPDEVAGRLGTFLGEPLGAFEGAVPRAFSSYGVDQQSFYKTNERWRALLNEREIALIERVAAAPMAALGYATGPGMKAPGLASLPYRLLHGALVGLGRATPSGAARLTTYLFVPRRLWLRWRRLAFWTGTMAMPWMTQRFLEGRREKIIGAFGEQASP